MKQIIFTALRVAMMTLILTGILYPLFMTGICQLFLPSQANGSLVKDERGRVVGSELIAQEFKSPAYFQPRPSAAGKGYDAANSSGSNLGPTSKKLQQRSQHELDRLLGENPQSTGNVPAELVAASASGLDPHLSPEAALWQVPRIAKARGIDSSRLQALIRFRSEGKFLWLFGALRVNILSLNLALDRQFGRPIER